MAKPDSLAWSSLALASAIARWAFLLGLRLWWERRTREEDLAAPDQNHFMLQDLRRAVGIGLMALLAIGVYYGSRLPTVEIEPTNPGDGRSVDSAVGECDPRQRPLEVHPDRRFLVRLVGRVRRDRHAASAGDDRLVLDVPVLADGIEMR